MSTDNLYILDVEGEENSLKVLDFFIKNIMDINKYCKKYIRIYSITPDMLKTEEIQESLKKRKICNLPSLYVFNPQTVLENEDEIIFFYTTLLNNIKKIKENNYQKRLKAVQQKETNEYGDEPPLMDDTQSLMNNFYKNEITNNAQEDTISNDIGNRMSDRYKSQLSQRASSVNPSRPKSSNTVIEEEEETLNMNKSIQNRRRQKDTEEDHNNTGTEDIMDSVRKVTSGKGADGDLELNFFTNLLEDSTKL